MPSKNNVNKPQGKIQRSSHASKISKRRSLRAKPAPTRSSAGRYNTETAPRPTDPKGLALYTGPAVQGSGVITQTLSKKKAKKLERNSRYNAQRAALLNVDLAAKDQDMEVDAPVLDRRERKTKAPTTLEKVKQALWTAVDDFKAGGLEVETAGEGTTLGVQAF